MKNLLLAIACFLLFTTSWVACSNPTPADKKPLAKKDSGKVNPLHPPAIIPKKMGAIAAEQADSSFRDFAFITDNQFIIITSATDTSWAKGAPGSPGRGNDGSYTALSDVNVDKLPALYSSQIGKDFFVGGTGGTVYKAKITGFDLYSACIPHFGVVQEWDGVNGEKPFTDEARAKAIWDAGALFLVAEFNVDPSAKVTGELCFAIPAGKTAPAVFKNESAPAGLGETMSGLVSKTAEFKSAQEEYAKATNDKTGSWWDYDGPGEAYNYFTNGKLAYGYLYHSSGNPCGGDFYNELNAVYTFGEGHTEPKLLFIDGGFITVLLVTDINNDGNPEFLVDDGFGNQSLFCYLDGTWQVVHSWNIPYSDCPC